MTTTYDEEAIDQLRSTIAVTKPQLAKLTRFMQIGKARIAIGNLRADLGTDGPGSTGIRFALDTPIPFTMPWKDSARDRDHGDQRLTATGVAVSDSGVHLLAYFTPLVGQDSTKEITSSPRATRWVPIDDVVRVEQVI